MARHAQPPALRQAKSAVELREKELYALWGKKVNTLIDLRGMDRSDPNSKSRALREIRMVLQSFRRTPKLFDCDAESIWDAVADAAGLGLELGGAAGECALIPFKDRCELVVEYGGKIKLMLQHPLVKSVNVQLWREEDDFHYDMATQAIRHTRKFNKDIISGSAQGNPRGDLVGAYCVVELTTGGVRTCVMDCQELYDHGVAFSGTTYANGSMRYGEEGFLLKWWSDSPSKRRAYMLKTVVHMVAKTVPKSPRMAHAMRLDTAAEESQARETIDAEFDDVPQMQQVRDGGPPPPPSGSTPPPNRTPPDDFMPDVPLDPDGHPEPGSDG